FNGFVQTVADSYLFGAGDEVIDKLGINTFLHDDATGRGAALSGGPERAPESTFDSEVDIGIVEHYHRILAAKLKRAALEAFGRRRAHNLADRRRPRERNGADCGMLGQRRPHFR